MTHCVSADLSLEEDFLFVKKKIKTDTNEVANSYKHKRAKTAEVKKNVSMLLKAKKYTEKEI